MKQQLSNFGIGASEVSTCAGLNPFASPWDLWLVKTGQKEAFAGNEATDWGHRLEPAIRQKYVDDTGAVVWVPKQSIFHDVTTWARATPDGCVLRNPTEYGDLTGNWSHLLQCKNVGFWVGKEWEQAPPVYVQLQEMWELYVTGLPRADVAALIGGNEFRIFTIHRDDRAIADLVTIASDFWRRVEQRIPPEIDNSAACKEHFEKRLAKASAVEIVADKEMEDIFTDWRHHSQVIKHATKEVERIRNVVRSHMADAQADRVVSTIGIAKLNKNKELMAPRNWSKEQ